MNSTHPRSFSWRPLLWVPSLYLAMGIPFNVIMSGTAANMYKSFGYSDAQITVALGSIGIAWSLKPLWAAFLDMFCTKKFFVLTMELLLACLFGAVAMAVPAPGFFKVSIALLWVAAFASSTQDICADGIYLTALDKPTQSRFAGVQGMFWVSGKVLATGGFVLLMDQLRQSFGWSEQRMWQGVMLACAGAMVLLFVYHQFLLPTGCSAQRPENLKRVVTDFAESAATFFHKRAFWGMLAFVFLYRLGEGLILMEGQLFLRGDVAAGGLGLTAGEVSKIDAIWSTLANIAGGLLGGWFVSRRGLSRSLWALGLFLNVPHLTFVILSHLGAAQHGVSLPTIIALVSVEKFGYGFGFVGNMIYMMQQLAPGRTTMTHYAFATALMNLMLVPTNMISGPLAEALGFSSYFLVVMVASLPSIWAAWKAPFPLSAEGAVRTEGDQTVTLDDPTRLTAAKRQVQLLAGRASVFAMGQVLLLLVADAWLLGRLQGLVAGQGWFTFELLVASACVKGYLASRAVALARQARKAAVAAGDTDYVGNARGAFVVTVLCQAATLVVLGVAAKLVF